MMRAKGYTLLEVLIVLAIFSVLSSILVFSFGSLLQSYHMQKNSMLLMQNMSKDFIVFSNDVSHLADLPYDTYNHLAPFTAQITNGTLIVSFVTLNKGEALTYYNKSAYNVITYRVNKKTTLREVLQSANTAPLVPLQLFADASVVKMDFLAADGKYYGYWPVNAALNTLPRLIRVTLKNEKFGTLRRYFCTNSFSNTKA